MDQNDPVKRCERLLDKFLCQMEGKNELTVEEARICFDIRETFKLTILTIGDVENGFPATAERFQKIVSLLNQKFKSPWHQRLLVWDNLISAINLKGDGVQVIREMPDSAAAE